ncbi:UDP-glucose/GDP-mannose dehydrogenase family protein [Bradyrhizobium sp. 153]|uniref:nucleotide sugar dehydrogenase n=1 Tax=Bradyrhizobium sp. 153 TaxID=2782627 RepID=UPI001FF79CDE|nr:UDP-glucose/GDP-mannose dehydrogenase family protein [Bradyrhizobium sp. 153]MCK1667868.1 UDP-glucose/GDP-mannose dehydrogenase family protein [Bradyrhizobium sp. 153]
MESLVYGKFNSARSRSKAPKSQERAVGKSNKFRISVFGIGYVGTVSAACLARDGHEVVAVDVNRSKVDVLNKGLSPIVEPRLNESILACVRAGRLRATTDARAAVLSTDISFICVGTPSQENGSLEISFVSRVAEEIGKSIAKSTNFHSVVMRSTMLPGTMEKIVIPILERSSNKRAGRGFGIAYLPEFLREGTAIADYDHPGTIVFGVEDDPRTLQRLIAVHERISLEPQIMSIRAAEAVKYANNAWHATKISFANEVGLLCKAMGVDSHEVMNAVVSDTKLNISPAYLKPGFAFGGSCLPKDISALRHAGRMVDIDTPLLGAVLQANENQIQSAFRLVTATEKRRIGLVGLSFKPDTDDLRYSPLLEIAERLIGRGYELAIYDSNIRLSRLTGVNRDYLTKRLPHITCLLRENMSDLVDFAEVLVVGNREQFRKNSLSLIGREKIIIDLVRINPDRQSGINYRGLCW